MGLMLVTILEVGDAINGSHVSDPLRVRKVFLFLSRALASPVSLHGCEGAPVTTN
jgi:hypothetical protein